MEKLQNQTTDCTTQEHSVSAETRFACVPAADHYQVILHVEKKDLEQSGNSVNSTNSMHVHNQDTPHNPDFPPILSKRSWIA